MNEWENKTTIPTYYAVVHYLEIFSGTKQGINLKQSKPKKLPRVISLH
jgi:hypothetical protein